MKGTQFQQKDTHLKEQLANANVRVVESRTIKKLFVDLLIVFLLNLMANK